MKQSNQEIETKHKAIDLYNIVLDIEKYPEYIPWCSKIEIIEKKQKQILANMFVDYKFFPTQIFASRVKFNLEKLNINTKYIEGPLKNLSTEWKFEDIKKNGSRVLFLVEFEFKNFFHQKMAEIFFPLVEGKMIKSFIKRADNTLK